MFDFIKKALIRRRAARLRRMVRAHRWLMADGVSAAAHLETVRRLAAVPFNAPVHRTWGIIPAVYRKHTDTVIRQKIYSRLLYSHLLPRLMVGRFDRREAVVLPIPGTWRRFLEREGFRIAHWRSRLAWAGLLVRFSTGAFVRTWQLLKDMDRAPPAPEEPYSVLLNAPSLSLPARVEDYKQAHGLVRWYRESGFPGSAQGRLWLRSPSITDQWRDQGIDIAGNDLPRLGSICDKLMFAARAAGILVIGSLRLAFGEWWTASILSEALALAYTRSLSQSRLASAYVFTNSSWIMRPLWTYDAEARGSRIVMLFYSTNMQRLMWRDGTTSPVYPGYEIMSWPEYMVWNAEQEAFLKRIGHRDAVYHRCGYVDIRDSGEDFADLPPNSVVVFDVTPLRPTALALRGLAPPYYSAETTLAFLMDVHDAISRAGMTMILKNKRGTGHTTDRLYVNARSTLEAADNFIEAPASVSPSRITPHAAATISIPFTSAALSAQHFGVPSVYYDPTGMVASLGPAHSATVEVLSGVDQLTGWLEAVANAPPRIRAGAIILKS